MHSTRILIARLLPYLILSHVSQVRRGSAHLSLGRPGAGVCPTRPPGHVTCDACWGAKPPCPVNRMTHRCKNITLPQTSFAGSINARSRQVLVVNELSNFAVNVCSTVTELVVRGTECNLSARSPYRSLTHWNHTD